MALFMVAKINERGLDLLDKDLDFDFYYKIKTNDFKPL